MLVDQDEARNIKVQHNVTLRGKFLEHQVDVYWELETAGIKYRTVIECKDWNRALEQEKLLAFRAKLEDLNGPVGIMVTRSGYQSGAVNYAKAHGIYLYEMFEEPPLAMKEGSFATFTATPLLTKSKGSSSGSGSSVSLVAEWTYYEPQYSANKYYLDKEWFDDQVRRSGEHLQIELERFTLPVQPLSKTKLYDEAQNEGKSILDVFIKKSEKMFHGGATSDRLVHRFSAPTFLKTDLESLPYLKITALSTDITILKHEPIQRTMRAKVFRFQ